LREFWPKAASRGPFRERTNGPIYKRPGRKYQFEGCSHYCFFELHPELTFVSVLFADAIWQL
jgi:hypothetical protein